MHKWAPIRTRARDLRNRVCESTGHGYADIELANLIAGAARELKVASIGLPNGHEFLRGALARIDRDVILFDKDVEEWIALYNQAHEMGHIELAHGARTCSETNLDTEASESKLPLGVHRVQGYGPQERIETEANVFAREILLPCDLLRRWFLDDKLNATSIAEKTGLSIELVCHQLAYALLVPEAAPQPESVADEPSLTLDGFQEDAACVMDGPQLIDAGPGTGKTRTLVGRILHLLNNDVDPRKILILTFSNKAAAELRERVFRFAPDQAGSVIIETFHSFGLNLLRKYGTSIGLMAEPAILDPIDSLFLLEQMLPDLNLEYYEYLVEPTRYLGDILKAISRAKDENVGPTAYLELANRQLAAASSPEETERAEKAIEVAEVYAKYQERLENDGALDLSDLICRSIELLTKKDVVRILVRRQHTHVLVDEYQDVNRASGLLLKALVGDGKNLWAVGDLRQSIHRWRGATTANIRLFHEDFPTARPVISLGRNYRSKPSIISAFSELAGQMRASKGRDFTPWIAHRTESSSATRFEVATTDEAEAIGIAREIERLNTEESIPYRDQAVICRTHTTLARIATVLEEENIPILYLGDFFERVEIRDMLSLLSLAYDPEGRALLRVARFPEYNLSLDDIITLRRRAKAEHIPFPRALELGDSTEGISIEGKETLKKIAAHLEGLTYGRSAWKTLTRYLFDRSSYLAQLLGDNTVAGQQRRLALYQLLQFVHSRLGVPRKPGVDPKHALLQYVRWLEIFGDEKQLRQTDEWADAIDAVRVMTIHASKGLEFRAVFVPTVAKTYLPMTPPYNPCPPPTGLLSELDPDWSKEEEECLFFVAMSRARDRLCISRALRYKSTNRGPSDLLSVINTSFQNAVSTVPTWDFVRQESQTALPAAILSEAPEAYDERDLALYITCPRKYLYQVVLGVSGRSDDAAYVRFHKCVYSAVRWMQTERRERKAVDEAAVLAILDETWSEHGPSGHHLEAKYRDIATQMIKHAVDGLHVPGDLLPNEVTLTVSGGKILVPIDHADIVSTGTGTELTIRRFRTGRRTKNELTNPIYGLLAKAANEISATGGSRVGTFYLARAEFIEIPLPKKTIETRVAKYEAAIAGIVAAEFPASPSDYTCNRCPHYFICPAAEG